MPAHTPPRTIGPALPDAGLDQPRDTAKRTRYGWEVTRVIRKNYATWQTGLPATGTAHPLYPTVTLETVDCTQHESGTDLCDVTLHYATDTSETGAVPDGTPVPPDEVSETGATVELDIVRHPGFTSTDKAKYPSAPWEQYWDKDKNAFKTTAPAWLYKNTKYKTGASQVSITKYFVKKPASPIENLGKLSHPGHNLPAEPANWRILTGGLNKRGGFWARTYVYEYSATPFPKEIYGEPVTT